MTITRQIWHDNYELELIEMFYITLGLIQRKYPHFKVHIEPAFHNFSRLIYHCSSKELSQYTKANLNVSDVYK